MDKPAFKQRALRETALLTGLLFVGFVVMPVAIYLVGQAMFGDYGAAGYGGFFAALSEKVRHGDIVAWFLILSPYLGWQCLRLVTLVWRATAGEKQENTQ